MLPMAKKVSEYLSISRKPETHPESQRVIRRMLQIAKGVPLNFLETQPESQSVIPGMFPMSQRIGSPVKLVRVIDTLFGVDYKYPGGLPNPPGGSGH
jgi:hypothetical protein